MQHAAAHIQAIGKAVPEHDVHLDYIRWAEEQMGQSRERALFTRMARRSGIDHRWSVLARNEASRSATSAEGFFRASPAPSTARRMEIYTREAPELALAAIADLARQAELGGITHLVVASCTGFVAPGIDQIIARRLGLSPAIERTLVGFMGCYAGIAALRVAHHIVRSDPQARVLVVAVELCSLHLPSGSGLDVLLGAMQFGDGAAAALVCAGPGGTRLDRFFCTTLPASDALIQWTIGDTGFDMILSGEVPARIAQALQEPELRDMLLAGQDAAMLDWAVHPGGRTIVDAVEGGLGLDPAALGPSRSVLARFGNMSSATILFVLAEIMARPRHAAGIAMAFGPGLAAEGFAFSRA
ncbi:MAG: type III polyketide synthase [Caenibius sp.]